MRRQETNDTHAKTGDSAAASPDASIAQLQAAIAHAAHLLPAQGPITVFIHHNTLHAFEQMQFDQAVREAGALFGCQPYLSLERFRHELQIGRIRRADLEALLKEQLGAIGNDVVVLDSSRYDLRLAMLQSPLPEGTSAELQWHLAVSGALSNSDDERLWQTCERGVRHAPAAPPTQQFPRHRDLLLHASNVDTDLLVNDVLGRFCAAFVDQGMAQRSLPYRDQGFFNSFVRLHGGVHNASWLRGLNTELQRWDNSPQQLLESIRTSLDALGVAPDDWDQFLARTVLSLRGWAGIIRFLEDRPDRAVHPIAKGSLLEFIVIRLILDRLAITAVARDECGYAGRLADLRAWISTANIPAPADGTVRRAVSVFQLASVLGWTQNQMNSLRPAEWTRLIEEVETFGPDQQQAIFQQAYELKFYRQTLDALTVYNAVPRANVEPPKYQVLCCIDEREESFRRHLEEVAPTVETFGIAGFYFVAMYYRGATDAHFTPLCPAVMLPTHWVEERVEAVTAATFSQQTKVRRRLGRAAHLVHTSSRSFATGALLSSAVGVLATAPLVTRTLFPRLVGRIRSLLSHAVLAPRATQLELERTEPTPSAKPGHFGFSLDEMTAIGERVLRDTGLTKNFTRIVVTLGHGSTSMNNPHESAHDCGACGGARGGPNGRAIAHILNDAAVRKELAQRGLNIPDETVFVGGMHNTSSEQFTFADVERIPASHRADFDRVRQWIETAGDRNAHERCRRFDSAPLPITEAAARKHVEGRAEDLAQVRPEWGHATNAVTFVGRRRRTRGLFLDRRAFMNSYDPTQDDSDGTILNRILQAAVPVCAGISLEYYFSYVDNTGYGSGTKLPHNIAGLLGVMDGAASDLRTGLPWQMVEIHEPMRHLFVIESTPAVMQKILDRNPGIARLVRNEWIHLALLDPLSATVHRFRAGAFERYLPEIDRLPCAASSVDWYRGRRNYLEFAEIQPSHGENDA